MLEPEEAVLSLAVDSWERRSEETAGGRDRGVVEDGAGCDGRKRRSRATSSYTAC